MNHPLGPFQLTSVILMARIPNNPSKLDRAEFYLTRIQSRPPVVTSCINVIKKSPRVSLGLAA